MKSKTNMGGRAQRTKNVQGEGPNWVLIAGGALLSTLSIRVGYKIKEAFDRKRPDNVIFKGSERSTERRRMGNCCSDSNLGLFESDEGGCFNCRSSRGGHMVEMKNPPNGQVPTEPDMPLPLATLPAPEYAMGWSSSPDRVDLPPKPFYHSNNSDSPRVSESGSDIFIKREAMQKLRQQLKRRDDLILEMQDQITELQNSLSAQTSHSNHLQAQLDAVNRELFDSQREIQRLRKAIADHCVRAGEPNDNTSVTSSQSSEVRNGGVNGFGNRDSNFERIEMMRREIGELKEVIEGKEYLIRSYKEQKAEMSTKIKELQERVDSQLPNIL